MISQYIKSVELSARHRFTLVTLTYCFFNFHCSNPVISSMHSDSWLELSERHRFTVVMLRYYLLKFHCNKQVQRCYLGPLIFEKIPDRTLFCTLDLVMKDTSMILILHFFRAATTNWCACQFLMWNKLLSSLKRAKESPYTTSFLVRLNNKDYVC